MRIQKKLRELWVLSDEGRKSENKSRRRRTKEFDGFRRNKGKGD